MTEKGQKDALLELLVGEICADALRWKHDDITGKEFVETVENVLLKFKKKSFAKFFRAMDEGIEIQSSSGSANK